MNKAAVCIGPVMARIIVHLGKEPDTPLVELRNSHAILHGGTRRCVVDTSVQTLVRDGLVERWKAGNFVFVRLTSGGQLAVPLCVDLLKED